MTGVSCPIRFAYEAKGVVEDWPEFESPAAYRRNGKNKMAWICGRA